MTFQEFVEDLQQELKDNPSWAEKRMQFAVEQDFGDLDYLSIYDDRDTVWIDLG